ncbi:Integrator complex subunit 6 [Branchiostoma belcheri]|nr:Integrator complex subunit 6 [Branchiostoma belcheri]
MGTTLLDVAKGAVETFLKLRQRDPGSRADRYMLVSFEDPPAAIKKGPADRKVARSPPYGVSRRETTSESTGKSGALLAQTVQHRRHLDSFSFAAGWKENHVAFMNELKNLQATGMTTMGQALKQAFDLLNLNRLVSGIDNYGQGRNPFFLEPAMVVTITDGSKLTSSSGVQEELTLPMNSQLPGGELTKEPFRWDQRLFSLVLRIPGVACRVQEPPQGVIPMDESPISVLCEITGDHRRRVERFLFCVRSQEVVSGEISVLCEITVGSGGISVLCEISGGEWRDLYSVSDHRRSQLVSGGIPVLYEITGGRSYTVASQKTLHQCLDSLSMKVQSGVVLHFEKIGPDPDPNGNGQNHTETEGTMNGIISADLTHLRAEKDLQENNKSLQRANAPSPLPTNTAWHSCHKLIYVRPNPKTGIPMGHWPIPEAFWPDSNAPTLLPRNAHPMVKFTCTNSEPMVIDNLPFDKYELEPSPLTQFILERKSPTTCWQCFVPSSGRYSDIGHPFGYLKASMSMTCVNLFIMPYNYPVLLPLLDELFKVHKLKPNAKWRTAFDNYLKSMPSYYMGPLKAALRRMGAPQLIPDHLDMCLSYSVISYLKKLKQQRVVAQYHLKNKNKKNKLSVQELSVTIVLEAAKLESDRIIASVGKKPPQDSIIRVVPRSTPASPALRTDFQQVLQSITGESPLPAPIRTDATEFPGFSIAVADWELRTQSYRNPFDIPRAGLLDQVQRMRRNLMQTSLAHIKFVDEDQLHSIPVQQMGNYQEYLKKQPQPLREVEPQPVRLHTFGNPFKLSKDMSMMVDEADVDNLLQGQQGKNKRQMDSPPGSPGPPGKRARSLSPGPYRRPQSTTNEANLKDNQKRPASAPPNVGKPAANSEVDMKNLDGSVNEKMDTEAVPNMDLTNHLNGDKGNQSRNPGNNPGLHDGRNAGKKRTPSPGDLQKVERENAKLKTAIFRELRRPGRHDDAILALLEQVDGPLPLRLALLDDVIQEAARFKRRVLIDVLQSFRKQTTKMNRPRKVHGHKRTDSSSSVSSTSSATGISR